MRKRSATHSKSGESAAACILFLFCMFSPASSGEGPPKHANVYKSDFGNVIEVGRWSSTKTATAPNGRNFLGEFGFMAPLDLKLEDLPEHRFVRVRLDLLVLKSWDGIWKGRRPDTWGIMQAGGPLVMLTTFCNPQAMAVPDPDHGPLPQLQCFPDEFPYARHKAGTGSSGEGPKLGGFKFREDMITTDSIYRIDVIFPHTSKDLALRFFGRLTHHANDESWGIDNVVIDTVDGVTPLDDEELTALWEKIGGRDPVAANAALWKVIAAGPDGLAFIEKSWAKPQAPAPDADPAIVELQEKIEELLKALTEGEFLERQNATKGLGELGVEALPLLGEILDETKDLEVRLALGVVVAKLRKNEDAWKVDDHRQIVRSRVQHIRRVFQFANSGIEITSSPVKKPDQAFDWLSAVADGYLPHLSNSGGTPRYTWFPNRGTTEWLRYTFPEPKTFSSAEVYWFAAVNSGNTDFPKSWEVQYQTAAGDWKPVDAIGDYTIEPDRMNQIRFKPVKTSAVRLSVELNPKRSAGVHEFRVNEDKP